MALEIERKFLVDKDVYSSLPVEDVWFTKEITQGYLCRLFKHSL